MLTLEIKIYQMQINFFKKIIIYKLEQGMEIFPKNKRKRDNTDVNDIRISQKKNNKGQMSIEKI